MQSHYRQIVDDKLRDTAGLISVITRTNAIDEAIKVYSAIRPRERVHTITGNGVLTSFSLPTDWEDGFSLIRSIEYPVDQQDPEYLDASEYRFYRDPGTGNPMKLRLVGMTLPNLAKMYVNYTVRHTVTDAVDTIILADREAVGGYAVAVCFRQLAAYYAQTTNSTLTADSVNYGSTSQQYIALARELERTFRRHLGMPEGDFTAPASVNGDLDVDLQGGFDRFFHPRTTR